MDISGLVLIIEGIIGTGKTTFSKILSEELKCTWLREPDEETGNPYLSKFYEDPKRWALTMQLHLLNIRFRMHKHAQWNSMQSGNNVVIDRSYFGDTAFARLQLKNGTLTEDEFNTYKVCYHNMTSSVLLPQICIYLVSTPEVSANRIKNRMEIQTGRTCENVIELKYLEDLTIEEDNMVNILDQQGVYVLRIPWNDNKSEDEIRLYIKEYIIPSLESYKVPDIFLDLHRRTI